MAIDLENGRILSTAFRGRGPTLSLGEVERVFGDFQITDGISLPKSWTATFNGQPADASNRTFDTVAVNPSLEPGLFTRPE